MKKRIKLVLGLVCAVVFAALVLQVKVISVENGGSAVVYILPFGYRPGGSAHVDLMEQLVPLYGEEGVPAEKFHGMYQGRNAVVYDTPGYTFQYLGRSVAGGHYISCAVVTTRMVVFDGGSSEATPEASQTRTCTYTGYDDGDFRSDERAKILWETETEDYSNSEAHFNSIVPAGN